MIETKGMPSSSPSDAAGAFAMTYSGVPRGVAYDAWRDELWQRFGRIDPEAAGDEHINCLTRYSAAADLRLCAAYSGSAKYERSRRLIDDQCDDFLFFTAFEGTAVMTQLGRPVELRPTEMLLGHMCEEGAVRVAERATFATIRVSRRQLLGMCPRAEDRMATRINHSPALRQAIADYLAMIDKLGSSLDALAQQRLAQHTLEMVAVLLDGAGTLKGPGDGLSSSAKLELIKRLILQNLADPELSVASVAARHGCHPKQVQRLFAATGRTFTEFLLEQRLLLARRQLTSAGRCEKISTIAFDCGFNDLSYFNRAFRNLFGDTPSSCRAAPAAA